VPLLLFLFARGRFYYTCGAYPMLLAMGSVVGERWLRTLHPAWRSGIATLAFIGVFAIGTYAALRIVPIASSGPLRDFALQHNGDLREEIGWDEIVAHVAAIPDGPALSSARTDHGDQLGMAARLSAATTHHLYRAGKFTRARRCAFRRLPPGGTHGQCLGHCQ